MNEWYRTSYTIYNIHSSHLVPLKNQMQTMSVGMRIGLNNSSWVWFSLFMPRRRATQLIFIKNKAIKLTEIINNCSFGSRGPLVRIIYRIGWFMVKQLESKHQALVQPKSGRHREIQWLDDVWLKRKRYRENRQEVNLLPAKKREYRNWLRANQSKDSAEIAAEKCSSVYVCYQRFTLAIG